MAGSAGVGCPESGVVAHVDVAHISRFILRGSSLAA